MAEPGGRTQRNPGMTDRNLNIKVAFGATNGISAAAGSARNSTAALAAQIKATQSTLKDLERQAGSFDRLSAASNKTAHELEAAKAQAAAMRAAYGPLKGRTDEQTAALEKQRSVIAQLSRAHSTEQQKLTQITTAIGQHGVVLDRSRAATEQISQATARYNQQLTEQQRRLATASEAQQRYDKAKATQEKLKDTGGKALAVGAATLAPAIASVATYSGTEDAMKGVAKQVNGLLDDKNQRTEHYKEMQSAIQARSEAMPLQNGAIDYAALVEGGARMGVTNGDDPFEKQKADLVAFADTAAMAAKAFELPAEQLSEDLGKIAGLYKIPTKDIEQLGDTINYLDDNAKSKGNEIIDVMKRVGGVADQLGYKNAAALGSTFLTLGDAPEIAASATNAMVRELSIATMQGDNFMEGLNKLGLSAKKIQQNMSKDAMGTIITVLEAVKKLPDSEQVPVLTRIFGKEFGKNAGKLANSLPELHRQLELVKGSASKGSMRKESIVDADSLSSQWLLLKAMTKNTVSDVGESLRPELMRLLSSFQSLTQGVRQWIAVHPQAVAVIARAVIVIGVLATALGSLALIAATVLGPLALLRMSISTLSGGTGFGLLGTLTSRLSLNLTGLLPSLSRVPAALLSWRAASTAAGGALGNVWKSITGMGTGVMGVAGRVSSGLSMAFTQPGAALSALGNGLRTLVSGGLSSLGSTGMSVFTALRTGVMLLISPISLIGMAIIGAGLLIYKYWQPIQAFFSGFFTGVMTALEPLKASFAALSPVFDSIGLAISRVWNWFKELFTPIQQTSQDLEACKNAGVAFGNVVGAALNGLVSIILKVAAGIGWVLEKLGVIPEAASAAAAAANQMNNAMPEKGSEPKKPVMYVWDEKQKKMVAQEWTPSQPKKDDAAVIKAGDAANNNKPADTPKPAAPKPPAGALDLKGHNTLKKDKNKEDASQPTSETRDPNKLGDIVFKNVPPAMLLSGGYAEPRIAASAGAAPKSSPAVAKAGAPVAGSPASPLSVQPAAATTPVSNSTAAQIKTAMSAGMASTDNYVINININDARSLDENKLAARIRQEIQAIERNKQRRRGAQLTDRAEA
ncbi:phage tail tape measure protein [Dickeya dadantii]|uniref:phage tail tape measure protein n=2 Tax=Dickeya dadantii TaxID=204038 RepID=UPI0035A89C4A